MSEKTLEEIKSYEPLEDVTTETRDEIKLQMREKEKNREKIELNQSKKEELVTWIKQIRESAQGLARVKDLEAAQMLGRNIDSGLDRFGRVVLGLETDSENITK